MENSSTVVENSQSEKADALESVIDKIKTLHTPVVSAVKKNFYFEDFLCGWGAAVINISVTYPINKVIFRQVSTTGHINIVEVLSN